VEQFTRIVRDQGAVRTRVLGILMLAGGGLAAITVALPPEAEGSDPAVLVCGAIAAFAGVALLVSRRELPGWLIGAIGIFGTALITLATYAGGGADTGTAANEVLYVWVGLFAFYFLPLPAAMVQLAAVGVAYALLLSAQGTPVNAAATQWVVTIGTLLVAGMVFAMLHNSLVGLVHELGERARLDDLTRLLNRHALEERAETEFARLARGAGPIAVLVCDIDGFKTVNDSLGHPAGDQVLRRVALVLEHGTREIDAVARVGGDEFALLLPDVTAEEARGVAERLRLGVRRSAGDMRLRLSISIGVAVGPACGDDLATLWQAADRAMYEAKRSGGDAVGLAEAALAGAEVSTRVPSSGLAPTEA
jgi:diguanylate cyclase (GGDEF)-like protein